MHHTVLAADGQAVGVGPPNADGGGAQRKRLDDVGAAADTGVEQHRQPVGGLHHPGQAVDGRYPAVGLAPTVVGAVDAIHAAVPGTARVVRMTDALDDQRQVGERPQPRKVVPRQRIAEYRNPAQHRGLRVFLGSLLQARPEHRVAGVVRQAPAAQLREVRRRQVARSPARHPGIQRDDDALVSGGLCSRDKAGRQLAVCRRVQLEKAWGIAEFGGNLFERILGQRRNDHRYAGARGGSCGGQITVAVLCAQADDADRRHEHRRR